MALRVQLPPGSVIVREDVVTDTLLHASVVVLHNTDIRPEIVPLESTAIAARIADRTNVYALPEAQRFLRGAGFVLVNPNLRDLSGVARVTRGGPCVGLQSAPTGLSRLAGATSVALSAPTLADVGPMVAYLSVDGSESPRPVEWPAAALREARARRNRSTVAIGAARPAYQPRRLPHGRFHSSRSVFQAACRQ